MKTGKLTACVCCAGLVLLSGCAADNGQEALNTAAGSASADTNITATVQPAASSALQSTSTPVKPTSAYTSQEPYYTLNPSTPTLTPTPTPEQPSLPIIEGSEFLRPTDAEIAKLKEVYEKAYGELKYNKQELLQDAIVSFDNACVGYDFYDYVFRNYDWSKGIPSSEDINLAFVDGYDKNYIVPIYSKNCKLIAYMYYEPQRNFMYGIRFVENSFGDEVDYCSVLPMHMKAHYVYSAVKEAQLGRIHNMILFTESSNYQYCVVDTDKGSYAYDFPYKTGYGVWVDNRAQVGILYTNIKEFGQMYFERLDNLHFNSEGGAV